MAPQLNDDFAGLRGDVQRLLNNLQDSNRIAAEDRAKLAAKVDALPDRFEQLRREQTAAIDTLRRDFERMFVSHAEYDPKHQVLVDKMREYDELIKASKGQQDEYTALKTTVKNLEADMTTLETRAAGTGSRIAMWGGIAIAVLSLMLNLLSHIKVQ